MTVENQEYHPEWGILREQDFVQLALKHQRDLETHFTSGTLISDFHFWQANLGGYCMADMVQSRMKIKKRKAFISHMDDVYLNRRCRIP